MMNRIVDPEVQALANISAILQAEYAGEELAWAGSPFAWIKTRPSRQVGTIGERLVAGWLAAKGFDVARSPDSDADRLIESRRAEIKFSTLWANGGYRFQQLRDQNYEFAICLGVSPFSAHCWVIPKVVILDRWRRRDGIQSQHGGGAGTDTAWIHVVPDAQSRWITDFGGTLTSGAESLSKLTGYRPT